MHFGSRLDFSEHYITTAHNRCLLSIIIITPLSGCIVCCVSCGDEVTFYFTVYSPSSSIYMKQMSLDTDWALSIILWSVQERLNYLIFKPQRNITWDLRAQTKCVCWQLSYHWFTAQAQYPADTKQPATVSQSSVQRAAAGQWDEVCLDIWHKQWCEAHTLPLRHMRRNHFARY